MAGGSGRATMFLVAVIAACSTAVMWGGLRAYTGIFDVLNLRVFVAALLLVAPLFLVPAAATTLTGWSRVFVVVIPFLAALPIVGGEWIGYWLSGRAIVWQRFNLIWLGILVVFSIIGCVGAFMRERP